MLKALILAAGFGSRLRPLTDDRPKALVPLGGRPVLDRTLDVLVEAGVKSVVVVTGYRRERLAAFLDTRRDVEATTVENPAYADTNTLASLLVAAPWVDDDFLLIDGDLVFEPAVLRPLLEPGTRLAVDRGRALDDDAVKIALDGGHVSGVGKQLDAGLVAVAESIGIARIDRTSAAPLFARGREILASSGTSGGRQAYYEAAFQRLIAGGHWFEVADVTGLRWVEIDDHDDLRRAETLFDR
ncbi:MAG: phosphocholine cytidylyltransferase family protein [Candidatus Rokubacteria bacterium]|nr:phosphocholine cytidylyltransferase family protein [Candidatus Rokubacteria bacterium]